MTQRYCWHCLFRLVLYPLHLPLFLLPPLLPFSLNVEASAHFLRRSAITVSRGVEEMPTGLGHNTVVYSLNYDMSALELPTNIEHRVSDSIVI